MSKNFAQNHTFSYLLTLNDVRNSFEEEHRPSWVKLTTITIVSNINQYAISRINKTTYHIVDTRTEEIHSTFKTKVLAKEQLKKLKSDVGIDIAKIKKCFEEIKTLKLRTKGTNFEGFEWSICPRFSERVQRSSKFHNQITLVYTDETYKNNKSVKLFSNGSIQIAGCSDLFDCRRIIKQISYILKLFLGIENCENNFRVAMINTNFSLNYSINLLQTKKLFRKEPIFTKVSFKPDRYSAVKIKFKPAADMKQVTASIFATGKIIVTGAETLKEIVYSYNLINQYINAHKNLIKVAKSPKIDVFDVMNGYKVEELVKSLKEKKCVPWHFTRSNNPVVF